MEGRPREFAMLSHLGGIASVLLVIKCPRKDAHIMPLPLLTGLRHPLHKQSKSLHCSATIVDWGSGQPLVRTGESTSDVNVSGLAASLIPFGFSLVAEDGR